ncbi:MAG: hypothetical protein K2G63_05840 [Oscillospiraceae bacterium]|nr:hypothetical protein [Oscillospiraceae bacterium]
MIFINSEDRYRAMPDRSHYTVCSDRITRINELGKTMFYYTFVVALIVSAGSMFNVRFNILSLLSDLAVGRGNVGASGVIFSGALNIITSLFLIIMAVMGKAKYKFCNVFLFCIYLAMPVASIINFGDRTSDIITIGLGIIGIYIYFPSLQAWRDYRVISRTEGFPYFNERFANQLENPKYKCENYHEDYADDEKPMQEIEKELTDNINADEIDKKEDNPNKISMNLSDELTPVDIPKRGDAKKRKLEQEQEKENKKSSLELARELAEKFNKFDFELEDDFDILKNKSIKTIIINIIRGEADVCKS